MTVQLLSTWGDVLSPPSTPRYVWLGGPDCPGRIANWKHTKTFPGGSTSGTFDFVAAPDLDHPALDPGRTIIAYSGSENVFTGQLEQPQPGTPWSFTITGIAALGQNEVPLVPGSPTTPLSSLNTVIDNLTGTPWTRSSSLSGIVGAPASGTVTLDSLLGSLVQQGGYWNVDDNGVITTPSGPPAVSYLLYATDLPPRTLSGYATAVIVRYTNSSGGINSHEYTADPYLLSLFGTIETLVDATGWGALASTDADAIGNGLLAKYAASGLAWASGFSILPGQLFTLGGTQVTDLSTIDANITVKVVDLARTGDLATPVNVPIGQVDYDDATGGLTLTPMLTQQDNLVATIARAHHIKISQ